MGFGPFQDNVDRGLVNGSDLPYVSQKLNSVRAYNFECIFDLPDGVEDSSRDRFLKIAAKQVTVPGFNVEEIMVHRFNDTLYYPGKVKKEDLKIVFDDTIGTDVSLTLFNWFKSIYDPITGIVAANSVTQAPFKAQTLKIVSLDGEGIPIYETTYFGVWPKSWKGAEFNYGTNEFHTVEVTFAYDFMNHAQP